MMLSGLLFDDAGHPMVATHASKNRVRYRYYMSAPVPFIAFSPRL